MVQITVDVNGVPTKMFLEKDFYLKNKNVALRLYYEDDYRDVSVYQTLSINLDEKLPSNMLAIKNYSEGEGNLDLLIKNNIISKPLYYVNSGYVDIPVCLITNKELLK